MANAKFILSKEKLLSQLNILEKLGFKILYSYKTNHEVGKVLQESGFGKNVDFSVHSFEELNDIEDKKKVWFFLQAESPKELEILFVLGVRNFVIDNEFDLKNLISAAETKNVNINLSIRMKFQEHRIGTGKYFVYGLPSKKVNELIAKLKDNENVEKLGIHIHRKSQNTSEWDVRSELEDSISKESLERINFVNLGGGLPVKYRSYNDSAMGYVFEKLNEAKTYLEKFRIEAYIEPGRFLAAPCVKLETEIIQTQGNVIVVNATIYQCALDTVLTGTKMLVEGEIEGNGNAYIIKGNSPTRDDIFRYKVHLRDSDVKIGNKIVFLNAGAYNYTTDFFGYHKLKTELSEAFRKS